MRDPERITETLEVLHEYWSMYPNMRLGQLLWEITGDEPYYVEDDVLIKMMQDELERANQDE